MNFYLLAYTLSAGGDRELPHIRGQGQRPRVPGCDGTGTAERSYPDPKAKDGGREEPPCVRSQGQCLRGATPRLRLGVAPEARATTRRSNPMPKARGGGQKEQPHVQAVVAAWRRRT